ncbi:MAG: hypothetical protein WD314_10270 [Trueperaceae bacterium]
MENVTREEGARASAPLWGALLAGAGAWTLHLVTSHFLVEAACAPVAATAAMSAAMDAPTSAAAGSGQGWVVAALAVLTVIAAGIALASVVFAWGRRRSLERRGPGLERAAGLATVITALSVFFVLLIVLESLPLLLIGCGLP